MQEDAPLALNLPFGHVVQNDEPIMPLYDPGSHGAHAEALVAPVRGLYVPAGQRLGAVAPAGQKAPAGQRVLAISHTLANGQLQSLSFN